MKQNTHDVELILRCVCNDPHHIIHLGFDKETPSNHGGPWPPELYVSFRTFYGSIWRRIGKALRLLRSGWLDAYPDTEIVGLDEVEALRAFCDECILAQKGVKT